MHLLPWKQGEFKISLLPKVKKRLRYLLQANDEIRPLNSTNKIGILNLTEPARSLCVEQQSWKGNCGKPRPDKLFARMKIRQQMILAGVLKFHFCSRQTTS